MIIDPQAVRRFAGDLDGLLSPGERLGVAVSGGPDSLALLLLASAARPGLVDAATVDHGLRAEAADEAAMVAKKCALLGVPHQTLTVPWPEPPAANVQAMARAARYRLLSQWARERGLATVATAHHADDQAETLLMRLARGSGLGGLAGVRADMRRDDGLRLVRPLLGWRKDELVGLCAAAGIEPADDPSNRDLRHDRARVRQWMASADLDPLRLAASAEALGDAEQAVQWAVGRLVAERLTEETGAMWVDVRDLPRELVRRLMLAAFDRLGAPEPRGADLIRAMDSASRGQKASLSGLLMTPGERWRLAPEPPRRT